MFMLLLKYFQTFYIVFLQEPLMLMMKKVLIDNFWVFFIVNYPSMGSLVYIHNTYQKLTVIMSKSRKVHNNTHKHLTYDHQSPKSPDLGGIRYSNPHCIYIC